MKNKYIKNSITALIIINFILVPLSAIPKKAEAQSLGAYTSGLIPAIAQLPLCSAGKLSKATKALFGGATAESTEAAKNAIHDAIGKEYVETWAKKRLQAKLDAESIQTHDQETSDKVDELKAQLGKIEKSTASLDASQTCLNSIGRLVTKMLLQKITVSTVNWINSGYEGKPSFVQDPGKFFNDIAKNEILQFGMEINNPELFPFGKLWLQNQAIAFNQKFTENAQYSLNDMIQSSTPQFSANSFQLDFSQGGWGAWSALTQVPANNPLGFQLMASDELQKRLQGTSQSTAENVRDTLKEASGFLGDYRCVAPEGVTISEHEKAVKERSTPGSTGPYEYRLCERKEYVTPGKLISEAATDIVHYPNNNLLRADDLNDAMAAIMDAALSRFSTDLLNKGFANLDDDGADGSFIYNPAFEKTNYTSQTEKDFSPGALSSSWISSNPDFNIRNDLTQALIDEQRTYADKLKLQNKELLSTTDGKDYAMGVTGVSNAYGLMPAIAQLDYCIPGPHPGFEVDSQQVLDTVTDKIIPETEQSLSNRTRKEIQQGISAIAPLAGVAIGAGLATQLAFLGSFAGPVGTIAGAAVGALAGWALNHFVSEDTAENLRFYYGSHIKIYTGVEVFWESDDGNNAQSILSKQGVTQTLNTFLSRYIDIVHLVYNSKILPDVAKESANEFNRLEGYLEMTKNNEEKISDMKNVVTTLENIKIAIEGLNAKKDADQLTDDQYENELKAQINAFGRLAPNMINGDDLASVDNVLKQIIDEKDYVYKDLLKGPLGCEQQLEDRENKRSPAFPDLLYKTARMDYPFPILYTYNVPAGGAIPDAKIVGSSSNPTTSGFNNHTSLKATFPAPYGPGFLGAYSFQVKPTEFGPYIPCVANPDTGTVPYCHLYIQDTTPMDSHEPERSLGKTRDTKSGPFEAIIGIY